MKPQINFKGALVYQLKGLYDAEKQVRRSVLECTRKTSAPALKERLLEYADTMLTNIRKLELAFDYMGMKPATRINDPVDELTLEMREILKVTSNTVRGAMVIANLQIMIHYKIAGYGTSATFAHELRLHTIAELMENLLRTEKSVDRAFTKLAKETVNDLAVEELQLST